MVKIVQNWHHIPYTPIRVKGAKEYGITAALVKTGKYKARDEAKGTPDLLLERLGKM